METAQIIDAIKARWELIRRWPGRPGYLGFALLGVGAFICGVRNDNGMGILLVTAIVAFVGEEIRLFRMVK